jgi:hypothetical protein
VTFTGRSPRGGQELARPADTSGMTPFVVTWFRFRHTRGGRRRCACWICSSM